MCIRDRSGSGCRRARAWRRRHCIPPPGRRKVGRRRAAVRRGRAWRRTPCCTLPGRSSEPMDYGSYTPRPRRDPRRRRRHLARRRPLVLIVFVLVVAAIIAAVVVSRGKGEEKTGGTKPKPAQTAVASASPRPKPTTPPPKVWVASKSDPARVWVGGDSMGGELGATLGPMLEKMKVLKPILYYNCLLYTS